MELASIPPPAALVGPQGTNKPSKKQAKLMQQRLDRLARVNIHLHGKRRERERETALRYDAE